MNEPALLALSRATESITRTSASAATSPGLRAVEVEVLLSLAARGPLRHAELAQLLRCSMIQPVTSTLRRQGLLTLSGTGQSSRLELDSRGIEATRRISAALDHRWERLCGGHRPVDVALGMNALRELASEPLSSPLVGWPSDLLIVLTRVTQLLVANVLGVFGRPGWTEAPVRPMLFLSRGPADTHSLALELGVGRPAVNLALTTPRRQGLIRRGPHELVSLTEDGMVAATQLSELANAPWVTVEQRFGPRAAATTARIVADLGRGAPARARN